MSAAPSWPAEVGERHPPKDTDGTEVLGQPRERPKKTFGGGEKLHRGTVLRAPFITHKPIHYSAGLVGVG
eukprot:scaffold20273_cov128-Isochrysis_galbana.AAC.3